MSANFYSGKISVVKKLPRERCLRAARLKATLVRIHRFYHPWEIRA
jgi:hypothetical protein